MFTFSNIFPKKLDLKIPIFNFFSTNLIFATPLLNFSKFFFVNHDFCYTRTFVEFLKLYLDFCRSYLKFFPKQT